MKMYFPHHCFCIFLFLVFYPDFSTKSLPSYSRRCLQTSTLRTFALNEFTRTLHSYGTEAKAPIPIHGAFAEASPRLPENEIHSPRKIRRGKSPKRRSRPGATRPGRRRRKKVRKGGTPPETISPPTKGKASMVEQRKRMEAILKEINSYKRAEVEEACGTKWTRNENQASNAKFQPHKTYGTLLDAPLQLDRNRRHVSDVTRNADPSVVYFSGRYILKRDDVSFRSNLFTVELWVKPEGGQSNPAVILSAARSVPRKHFDNRWSIGIMSPNTGSASGDEKPGFYFSLKSSDGKSTIVRSPYSFKPEEWAHLAVSCGGGVIRLYVNAVQVGVRHDPRQELSRQETKCDTLILGGNEKMTQGYRGMVDNLRVWSAARPQPDISDDMYNLKLTHVADDVIAWDKFGDFENWAHLGEDTPMTWNEDTPEQGHRVHFPEVTTPSCGQTICDNPEIVKSYAENWILRQSKTLRYSVVNVNEYDGTRPMFTTDDVTHQASLLTDVFGPHNITWTSTVVQINDSRLRRKTIGCEPAKIGNRQCDMECNHARMGFDGGDCDLDFTTCDQSKKGNGHCDDECNKMYHDWDMGDCCDSRYTDPDQTCFDPTSPNRAYISVAEYKTTVGADNSRHLSVLFANWSNPNSIGISTFPWDKEVFTSQGGTVVQLRPYASKVEMSGLVHEIGHNLGLLHVHHGAHNVDCDDICAELQASMTTGDLCEDTNPTPMNTNCNEPTLTHAMCSIHNFTRTPYSNFMSYADGSCQDNFTPQQRARMHCYIDLVYNGWLEGERLAPIPLASKVVAASRSERTITIAWAPPINGRQVASDRQCDSRCTPGKRLRQYATSASSPGSTDSGWSAGQATGPPDQAACTLRGIHFWMAAWSSTTYFDCNSGCSLDLEFENAVVPSMLRIWVSYGTEDRDGIQSVELLHEDNTKTTITGLSASCDTPVSLHLQTNKMTKRIRVNVTYPYTAIDAVEMISKESDAVCTGCRRIKYKIHRDPPFPNDLAATTERLKFTDRSCEEGVTYSYSVQPHLHRNHHGELSPPVQFRLGQFFCGDGIIQTLDLSGPGEKCDDGNMENEDGCSSICVIEEGFHCKGQPSTCYWHEGDGICEEFERIADSPDCARDAEGTQWAIEASSSSAAMEAFYIGSDHHSCRSTKNVLGPPDSDCSGLVDTWSPCTMDGIFDSAEEHWLKVVFKTPVVPASISIYLGSVAVGGSSHQGEFSILLPGGEMVSSGAVTLSCVENPTVINVPRNVVVHKLNEIIIKFSSQYVAIDAVSLNALDYNSHSSGENSASSDCVMEEMYERANVTCQITNVLSATGSAGTVWPHHTRCSVLCNRGYIPRSTQWITCRNGIWDTLTECVPISCGAPSHVKFASFSCENGHKLNGVCNFTCWSNARMIGTDNTFVCGEDGVWSVPTSHCQTTCGPPPTIGFSTISCDDLAEKPSTPGDTCKYRCISGYQVTQQVSTRKSFRLTCGPDGEWKGARCQPVLCPPLPTIYKGRYTCTRGLLFGSECTMSCLHSRKNETIRCEGNGRWNSTFSLCSDIVTSCEFPSAPAGVEIICDGLDTGQACQARCVLKEGRSARDISALSDELDTHTLNEPDAKMRLLVCTGERWFPNPEDLFCIDPCDIQLKRDGFCDAINNRPYCDWDGGDCCIRIRHRGRFITSCNQKEDTLEEKDVDMRAIKSPTSRSKNRHLFAPLRAMQAARMSAVDDGRRHKKKRRNRDRNDVIRTPRSGRDDSRRKHKHRRRHSGDSRRRRKHKRSKG